MSTRIYFEHADDNHLTQNFPAYAMRTYDDYDNLAAVKRSIERASGYIVATCRVEHYDNDGQACFAITLATEIRGVGGLSIDGEVRVWIN